MSLASKTFDSITRILTSAKDSDPKWGAPLASVKGENSLESDNRHDIFELLQSVEQSVLSASFSISQDLKYDKSIDELQRDQKTATAERFRNSIVDIIDKFKSSILTHPINIILGSFLIDSGNQQKISKISIFDFEYLPNGAPRSVESFLKSFPYDYLAAVYKIAFDVVVRMRPIWPCVANFQEEEYILPVFRRRAHEDVREVRSRIYLCLLIYIILNKATFCCL